jgi:RES domain-containing protein
MATDSLFACDRCFQDSRLREYILKNGQRGNCFWCHGRNRFLIPLHKLGPLFRDVAAIYDEVDFPHGDNISFLLQEDWSIFGNAISEARDERMQRLCVAILNVSLDPREDFDTPNYAGGFRRREPWLADTWDRQLEAILTGNLHPIVARDPADPDQDGEPDPVEVAYEDLMKEYPEGNLFYRARIHKDRSRKERFTMGDLTAPPPEKAKDRRANRAGEPALYVASDMATALAEVRAWKGAAVAIAKMVLRKRSRIIDLLNPEIPASPFFEEYLNWKLELAGLLHRLADELSRPIIPDEDTRLYLPTQHLCELIRRAGYDGVAYPSAMGQGSNVVLFDPRAAEPIEITYVRVRSVLFDPEEIPEYHDIYEEGPFDYLLESVIRVSVIRVGPT